MANCYEGCSNCDNSICSCSAANLSGNEDFQVCYAQVSTDHAECVAGCDDFDCIFECDKVKSEKIKDCPCQENCPTGCPCPSESFECPSTKPTPPPGQDGYAVLALNSAFNENKKILIPFNGSPAREPKFTFEDGTLVWMSCTVTYKGQFYVIGGQTAARRQLSVIENCSLKQKSTLGFDSTDATCENYSLAQSDIVLICFSKQDKDKCKQFDGDNFIDFEPLPLYRHYLSPLAKYKGLPFVAGSANIHVHTEMLENENGNMKWIDLPEYPFHKL